MCLLPFAVRCRGGRGGAGVHACGHAHAESIAVRWTGDEELLHSQSSCEAAGASLGAWLPERLPKESDPTVLRAHALLRNARQGAAAVGKLAASIAEAKESIYNAQGDYLDDINLWQDAQDQYLDYSVVDQAVYAIAKPETAEQQDPVALSVDTIQQSLDVSQRMPRCRCPRFLLRTSICMRYSER
eukprot:COSAG02_NODE_20181_length_845_cov_0.786863_1_plen_186_part_00